VITIKPATSVWAASIAAALLAGPAQASVEWDGDASQGTGVFKNLEQHEGSITAITDSVQGRIFRFNKPNGSNRCESRGIRINGAGYTFQNGQTHYFGWRHRLSTTADNNANFQWKSYGNHIQNWPVVVKMVGGRTTIIQRQPGSVVSTIWSGPITANTWNHYVLGLHLSDATRGGWVELWYRNVRQTFNDGTQRYLCRTFDDENDPKWGIYGGSTMAMINDVDGLKMGTTPGDVAEEPIVTPTSTPTPTTPPVTPTATPTPTSTPCTPCNSEITPGASGVTASTNDGNLPSNTVDNTLATRWSGSGDGAWIKYNLGGRRILNNIRIAVYNGDGRRNRFDIQVSHDDVAWSNVFTDIQSSGTTTVEERYDFPPGTEATYVRYVGHMSNVGTFNSVTEVSVFGTSALSLTPTPTAPPTATPTPTPTATPTPTPATPVDVTPGAGAITASTNDGNVPGNTVDNNLATRWSANGDGQWIQYDLGTARTVTSLQVAWYQGNTRASTFDAAVSDSPTGPWTVLVGGQASAGNTTALETYDVTDGTGRYVRLTGHGNSVNGWNSLTEVNIFAAP